MIWSMPGMMDLTSFIEAKRLQDAEQEAGSDRAGQRAHAADHHHDEASTRKSMPMW